ncbi:MAG: PD-(D/E)XK nuclease family protein, partial [Planctomycetota bacterium]|nr:PD-(D/E)XK nuclease family protein [Planctomycetota bacterium]
CQQQYPDCNSLVKTQVELLKIRFKKFAKVQAKRAEDGWKILHCEYELPKGCRLFGSNFDISGKIDRIDVRDNEICLIDYKTPNDSKNYKKIFRKNKFSDLQLPLYQFLSKFIEGGKYDGMRKSIAYFLLTANPNETDVYSIDFEEDERSAAEIQCTDIFEAINQQRWLELGKAPFASEAEKAIRGDSLLCSSSALEGNQ